MSSHPCPGHRRRRTRRWRRNAIAAQGVGPDVTLPPFAVTFDYRCPFARNAHEHLLVAQRAGAGFEVTYLPFSLDQAHREPDAPSVFDEPDGARGIKPVLAALVVMEQFPDRFPDLHWALFRARHDEARDAESDEVLAAIVEEVGLDAAKVMAEAASGWPLEAFRRAHTEAVSRQGVFGVPTFIVGEDAAFVRVMTRPTGDGAASRRLIEQLVTMLATQPEINEFKRTRLPQ